MNAKTRQRGQQYRLTKETYLALLVRVDARKELGDLAGLVLDKRRCVRG